MKKYILALALLGTAQQLHGYMGIVSPRTSQFGFQDVLVFSITTQDAHGKQENYTLTEHTATLRALGHAHATLHFKLYCVQNIIRAFEQQGLTIPNFYVKTNAREYRSVDAIQQHLDQIRAQ